MSSSEQFASDTISPPLAGQVTAISVSATPGSQDLRLCGNQTPNTQSRNGNTGLQGRYVTFYADGADVGLVFGSTSGSVTGANAPVFATTGVNVAGCCVRIANGGKESYFIPYSQPGVAGLASFVGFVASAAGILRIVASSP